MSNRSGYTLVELITVLIAAFVALCILFFTACLWKMAWDHSFGKKENVECPRVLMLEDHEMRLRKLERFQSAVRQPE